MKFNAPKFQSDPNEIRLKDGESVQGVLRGDIFEFESAFKPTDKPKFRFKVNMVLMENGALVCKILSGGWKLYSQLRELSESGWDLETSFVRVSRTGSGINDTVYSATALPKGPTPETLQKIAAFKLRVLNGGQEITPPAEPTGEFGSDPRDGDIGF